jgi:hypothetical protein
MPPVRARSDAVAPAPDQAVADPPVQPGLEDPVGHGLATATSGYKSLLDPLTQFGGGTPGENVANAVNELRLNASGVDPDASTSSRTAMGRMDAGLAIGVGLGGLATAAFDTSASDEKRALSGVKGGLKTTQGIANTIDKAGGGSARAAKTATAVTGPLMALDALGSLHTAGKAAEQGDGLGVVDHTAIAFDRGARSAAAFSKLTASAETAGKFAEAVPMVEAAANLAQAPIRLGEAIGHGKKASKLGKVQKDHASTMPDMDGFEAQHIAAVRGGRAAQKQFESDNMDKLGAKRLGSALDYAKSNKEIATTLKTTDAIGHALDGIGTFTAAGDMGITKAVGVGLNGAGEAARLGQKAGDRSENVSAAVDADDLRKGYDKRGLLGKTFDAEAVGDLGGGGQALNLATGGLAQGLYSGARGAWKAGSGAAKAVWDATSGADQVGPEGPMGTMMNGMATVGRGVLAGAAGLGAGALTGAAGLIGGTAKGLYNGAKGAVGAIGTGAKYVGKGLVSAGEAAAPAVKYAGDKLSMGDVDDTYKFNALDNTLGETGSSVANLATAGLAQGVTSAGRGAWKMGSSAAKAVWDATSGADQVGPEGPMGTMINGMSTLGRGVLAGAAGLGAGVVGGTAGLIGGTAKGLGTVVRGAGKLIGKGAKGAFGLGKSAYNGLGIDDDVENGLGKNKGGALNLATGGLAQGVTSAGKGAWNAGTGAYSAISEGLGGGRLAKGVGAVGGALAGVAGGAAGLVAGTAKGAWSGLKTLGRGVKNGVGAVGGAIGDAVGETGFGKWFKSKIWGTRDGKDLRKLGKFLTPKDSDKMLLESADAFDEADEQGNEHINALRGSDEGAGKLLKLQDRLRGNQRTRAAKDFTAAHRGDYGDGNKGTGTKAIQALGVDPAAESAYDQIKGGFDW